MAKNINLKIELQNAQQAREELIRLQDSTIEGSKQFKKLEEQIKKLDEVTQDYSDAVTELEIAQNNGAKNTKFFSENLKKAEKSLEQATKKSNSLSTSVSKLNEATEQASQGWSSLTDGFSQLKSGDLVGGLNSIKDGIGGMTKASLAFIATPIGATIAALAGIAAGAKALWDYNSALSASNKTTEQFTGLTGDSLDVVDAKTKALMDQTGASQEEVLRSVQAMVKQFGISYDEAFDQISLGYMRSGKSAEDFFDNVAEYSGFFESAGYSAEEMFGIIEAGAENGIYKDKILDSVKEMDIALKEMPKASADALKSAFGTEFANNLSKGINDGTIKSKDAIVMIGEEAKKSGLSIQDQAKLTADVFKSAGEDAGGFADVIETINLGLEKSTAELSAVEKAQQESNNAQAEMNVAFRDLFGMSEGGFSKMKSDLMGGVYKGITLVINGVIDCYNWFAELYNKSYAFRGVVGSIGAVAQGLFNIISANIKNVVNGFKSLGDLIEAVFTGNFSAIPSIISNAFKNTKEVYVQAGKDTADAFVEAWDEKGGKLKTIEKKNTKMVIDESNKATKEVIKNNNKAADNHEKNEGKKRSSNKKTADEAAKAAKELGELLKSVDDIFSDDEYSKVISKLKKVNNEFTALNELFKKSGEEFDKSFYKMYGDDNTFLIYDKINKQIEQINISNETADAGQLERNDKLLVQLGLLKDKLIGIDAELSKVVGGRELNPESLFGGLITYLKNLEESEKYNFGEESLKQFKDNILFTVEDITNSKELEDLSKNLTTIISSILVNAEIYQPSGIIDIERYLIKVINDQIELNRLTDDYNKNLLEIYNKQKEFNTTDLQMSNSSVNGFMETLDGGEDIFGAKSRDAMKAEIEAIAAQNSLKLFAEKTAAQRRLEELGASEEAIQSMKDYYRQQEIDAEQKKNDAILQIDQLAGQRREAALSQTADTLSQASGLFAEHTTAYKVFAIAAATIDTYQSAMAAYKGMVAAIPGPWGIAAGIAAAASSVAFGIKQIKEIQKVDTGGSAGGSTAIANVSQSPNVQFVSSGDNQIAQTIASSQASSEELRVVVTANDIQNGLNTQARVRNNSSL